MTISCRFPAVEATKFQIFNYFVNNVTEVNLTVAIAKCTTKEWDIIVVIKKQPTKKRHRHRHNAQAPQKRALGVKIKRVNLMGGVIYINN